MISLAAVLPCSLIKLSLGLQFCLVGSAAVQVLATRLCELGAGLRVLCLDFLGTKVDQKAVIAVARTLSPNLLDLTLNFGDCDVGAAGAKALAENMPKRLHHLGLLLLNFKLRTEGLRILF